MFARDFQPMLLSDPSMDGTVLAYETITLYGAAFQQTSATLCGPKDGLTHIS